MTLRLIESETASAEENMRRDAALLDSLDKEPILHLYDWENPSATYGHFISLEKHIDLEAARKHRLIFAKRPTGGGIVFHIWDYAFSFLMPSSHPQFSLNTLDNYRFVNEIVLNVMKEFLQIQGKIEIIAESYPVAGKDCQNFCMARPTQYDVVLNKVKIAGAAQRKTKKGYLHQGTISLACPDEKMLCEVLLAKDDVLKAMLSYSFAPLGSQCSGENLRDSRIAIKELLKTHFKNSLSSGHIQ